MQTIRRRFKSATSSIGDNTSDICFDKVNSLFTYYSQRYLIAIWLTILDFYVETSYLTLYCMPYRLNRCYFLHGTVQTSNELWWAVHMCLFQIPWDMFLPKISKIEWHLTDKDRQMYIQHAWRNSTTSGRQGDYTVDHRRWTWLLYMQYCDVCISV